MKLEFISLFPRVFDAYFGESIVGRAITKGLLTVCAHDLRKWARGPHRKVDDRPYGGGPGMVMMVEPFLRALEAIKKSTRSPKLRRSTRVILLAASGTQFTHRDAVRLAKYERLIFLCPRYEGVDARVDEFVDERVSIGPYVVTGGELPAMVIADAVVRHLPGVLGKAASLAQESHASPGLTEYPQYTRPEEYNGKKVPAVLLSGDHARIAAWRKKRMRKAK